MAVPDVQSPTIKCNGGFVIVPDGSAIPIMSAEISQTADPVATDAARTVLMQRWFRQRKVLLQHNHGMPIRRGKR